MLRSIEGFHQDDEGHWVAQLSCLHSQHVRHQPPWQDRPWVTTASGRRSRMGEDLDCPLCDRAELPAGLHLARTAGPFDARSLPLGLQHDHRVAPGTWGRLRIIEGTVRFTIALDPPAVVTLAAGECQAIPPGIPHALELIDPVLLAIDFLVLPTSETG